MELVTPLATSAIRFVTAPAGTRHVFVPDFVSLMRERYQFWEAPQTIEQFNLSSGARFKTGRFGGTKIDALTIYSNGLSVEGHAHSSELDDIADDILSWAAANFGIDFVPTGPVEKGFTSAVEVRGSPSLVDHFVKLAPVMERLTSMVASYGFTLATYQATGVIAQSEPSMGKPLAPGRFIFEHRVGTPLTSGVYYSEAPISTDQHLDLLDLLESVLSGAQRSL